MLAGVVHNQMPTTVGGADAPRAQELTTLQIGRALRALGEDFPGADRKGGKEGEGAMANILKLLAFDQTRRQGQRRRQAFQGLEVGLLVETEHPPAPGWRQIEGEHLGQLLLKAGVGAGQEVRQALGLEDQGGHNPLARRRTHGQNLAAPGTRRAKSRAL
jgi:hypothetical protein